MQEQHFYPYGAPLTGLCYTVGGQRYRHGYQGQYAEQDTATGWDSFELRLYDSRIGRWFSPDPYGQYASPYVGMGANPVSGVDADGGWSYFHTVGAGFVAGAIGGGLAGPKSGGSAVNSALSGGLAGAGIAAGCHFVGSSHALTGALSSTAKVLSSPATSFALGGFKGTNSALNALNGAANVAATSVRNVAHGFQQMTDQMIGKSGPGIDSQSAVEAAFGMVGGGLEVAAGVVGEAPLAGTTTALIIDGGVRFATNTVKLTAALRSSRATGHAMNSPTSVGGCIGYAADKKTKNKYGFYQKSMGLFNDVVTTQLTGGMSAGIATVVNTAQGGGKLKMDTGIFSILGIYIDVMSAGGVIYSK